MTKISQCGERFSFDVLVVGSGAAGLSFCIEFSKKNPEARIALIMKKELQESNSWYAQGGMAAVALQADDVDVHIQDTLKAGGDLCRREAVEHFIKQAPSAIQFLQSLGVQFDIQLDLTPDLAKEGGTPVFL